MDQTQFTKWEPNQNVVQIIVTVDCQSLDSNLLTACQIYTCVLRFAVILGWLQGIDSTPRHRESDAQPDSIEVSLLLPST